MYQVRIATRKDMRYIVDDCGFLTAIDLEKAPLFYILLSSDRPIGFAYTQLQPPYAFLNHIETSDLSAEETDFFIKGIVYNLLTKVQKVYSLHPLMNIAEVEDDTAMYPIEEDLIFGCGGCRG